MNEKIIEIKHLRKSFGENEVLKDISVTVNKGEVVTIIGSSGSGKSTFLRCINLLEKPTGGEIIYNGENVLAPKYNLPKYRTNLGMVFQSFNLFNNMNVLENCMSGQTTVLKRDKETAKKVAIENLAKSWYGSLYRSQTSTIIWWTETACRNCSGIINESRCIAIRRTYFGVRP